MTPKYVWMRPLLSSLITVGLLCLTGYMTWMVFKVGIEAVPKELLVLYVALVQAFIVMATNAFGFYFGTSQGSANKSATIDSMLNGSGTPPPPPVE